MLINRTIGIIIAQASWTMALWDTQALGWSLQEERTNNSSFHSVSTCI